MKLWKLVPVACLIALVINHFALADTLRQEPIQPVPAPGEADSLKIELGKKLWFEPRLSKSGLLSCNSCHNLATGGADNLPTSIGHKWQSGSINSPTVLNAKFNLAQFWDGRSKNLKEQAGEPIKNPVEMAFTHEATLRVLESIPEYAAWFRKAYGSEKITMEQVTDAIASFEGTLLTPDSKFDQWLKGDDKALSETEKSGYKLFKDKGCVTCHTGLGVGGTSFQKFGIVKPYEKDTKTLGRYEVTKKEQDKYVFKVPLLRNIALTAPYFHDASTWDMTEAVLIMAEYQFGIPVNRAEALEITAFLQTLTGNQPSIRFPILPPSTATTPKPQRD